MVPPEKAGLARRFGILMQGGDSGHFPTILGDLGVIGTRNKQSYFSLSKDKKTHLIYLGKKRENRARKYSANYKKLLEIIEEMTLINMKLLKEDACL